MIKALTILPNRMQHFFSPTRMRSVRFLLPSLFAAGSLFASAALDQATSALPPDEASQQLADCGYFLEAMKLWDPSFVPVELEKKLEAAKNGAAVPTAAELRGEVIAVWQTNREKINTAAKRTNQNASFRVGLARDSDPSPFLDEWALFRLNAFRIAATSQAWMGKGTIDELFERSAKALEKAAEIGALGVIQTGGDGKQRERHSADFTFNDRMIPGKRSGFFGSSFNSAPFRRDIFPAFDRFAATLSKYPAAGFIKLGNEPFWTITPAPAVDFGQATIGCSPETFQQQAKKCYANFGDWKKALLEAEQAAIERSQKDKSWRSRYFPVAQFFPWADFGDMRIPQDDIAGLTFVDYLKGRYSSLEELNRVWFGEDRGRWFRGWDAVFPPLPVIAPPKRVRVPVTAAQADIPETAVTKAGAPSARAPEGMEAAWADWLSFQPFAINNYHVEARASILKNTDSKLPVTTNCICGHYLNNFNNIGAISGLNPWDTPKGLDTLAIDFYTIRYLQGYMRSLACAADGRPVQIYEAGGASGPHHTGEGADPNGAAYMTLYSFAHGADMLLYWRRDGKLDPVMEIEIARAMKAICEPDLQNNSVPVTDGTAMVYSQDSLYLAQALDGTPERMIWPFQVGLRLAQRLHYLFDFYSDRQVAEAGIPAHVNVLVVPGAFAVSDKFADRVEQFLAGGGKLVAGADFASRNEHGKPRNKPSWLTGKNVLLVPETDWLVWDDRNVRNQDFLPCKGPLPEWAQKMDRFIQTSAPRTVEYRSADGTPSEPSLAAARKSPSSLYVFLNPGAQNVSLEVTGKFGHARDLYRAKDISVSQSETSTIASAVSGPAVIRFTNSSP